MSLSRETVSLKWEGGRRPEVSTSAARCKEYVHDEADGHDDHAVDRERESHASNKAVLEVLQIPTPLASPSPGVSTTGVASSASDTSGALSQRRRVLDVFICGVDHVVIFFKKSLVMDTIRVADFVVKQTREDEADGCRTGASHECKHSIQTIDSKGGDVCERENQRRQKGEACVGHGRCYVISPWWWRRGISPNTTGLSTTRSPLHHRIQRSTARVHLEGDREENQDHDGCFANS